MQDIAQDFEQKLYTTSGKLSFFKYFWYLTKWVSTDEENSRMLQIGDSPGNIILSQEESTQQSIIERLEPNIVKYAIGVRLNPQETPEIEYIYCLKHSIKLAKVRIAFHLTCTEPF